MMNARDRNLPKKRAQSSHYYDENGDRVGDITSHQKEEKEEVISLSVTHRPKTVSTAPQLTSSVHERESVIKLDSPVRRGTLQTITMTKKLQ